MQHKMTASSELISILSIRFKKKF